MSKKPFVVLGVIVVVTMITHGLLLGSAPYHKLEKTAPLYGAVSQAIGVNDKNSLAVGGKDYALENVRYFGGDWLVASVVPTPKSDLEKAVVIMQKRDGIYRVVLGPGTAFDSSILISLPSDIGNFLTQQGYIYEYSYR